MRLLHLGDLHFGKRIDNLSLTEDQKYICREIFSAIDRCGIEAVLISGDVYDKSVPSEEAVRMFDDFLVELDRRKLPVLLIPGNHDSAERLSFCDRLLETSNIYISPQYNGNAKKVVLHDEYGAVNFYLLPFIKPIHVQSCFKDENIETYTDAVKTAIDHMNIDVAERNVILSHQFVTGSEKDGSEDELYVGGTSNVDSWVYEVFDYAALGHIHKPQAVAGDKIRYCGSPMKYSFNEVTQEKGLTVVDVGEKGQVDVEVLPITPLRDFVTIKGFYDDVKLNSEYAGTGDFVHVVLFDENDIPNAYSNLSLIYPNIISLSYDNARRRNTADADDSETDTEISPFELFSEFFEKRNGQSMDEDQASYMEKLISEIWEE